MNAAGGRRHLWHNPLRIRSLSIPSLFRLFSLPESLFALLRRELIEGFGLVRPEESVVVVVEVLRIVVDFVAELGVVVNPVLLLGGFARDAEHGERQAEEELRDGHGG